MFVFNILSILVIKLLILLLIIILLLYVNFRLYNDFLRLFNLFR